MRMPLILAVAAAAAAAAGGVGAVPPDQFTLIGPLQEFNVPGAANDPLRPGTLKVQGVTVVLPRNLLVQMPTVFLSPGQIVAAGPGGGQSGLALADAQPPVAAYEATVIGNVLAGTGYVAGLVSISQGATAQGAGHVRRIELTTGEIVVGARPSQACISAAAPNDPACVVAPGDVHLFLNDPKHRFTGPAHRVPPDGRFAVDDENASVRTDTGYPVCVPASTAAGDPRCPMDNRPRVNGTPQTMFVMDAASLVAVLPDGRDVPACQGCDPKRQLPLLPGDHVIYAGVLAKDGANVFVSAYALTAELGIFTAPGRDPAYVAIESSLVGTAGGPTIPSGAGTGTIPQEAQTRFKIEGFTTDPSRPVSVYEVDINPSDGTRRKRLLSVAPKAPGVFGRFRFQVGRGALLYRGANGAVVGVSREIAVALGGVDPLAEPTGSIANGLAPGRYVAPVNQYVFPENTVFGDPVVPANFECLAFLQLGTGPLGGVATAPNVGRLAPWPGGAGAPTAVACPGAP